MCPIFFVLSIETYFTITPLSSYNVCKSHGPSCQYEMSRCHNTSVYLACSYQKARWKILQNVLPIISAQLIEIKEKRGKLSICSLTNSTVHQHIQRRQMFPIMPRFLKFQLEVKWSGPFQFLPIGIFRIISVGSRSSTNISVGPV